MKKLLTILVLIIIPFLTIRSQDYKTSLGLRAGLPYGLSGGTVKHFLNRFNAVEGILAFNFNGIVATGLIQNEHWTGYYPGINWYWGLGAHVGVWGAGDNRYLNSSSNYTGGSMFGVDGILGVEYTFDDIPLNLSVDVLPTANLIGYQGINLINGAISIRYVF